MKRFYEKVDVAEVDGGWQVTLDGRGIKTVKGAPQIAPSHALAKALAREWEDQPEELDPARFILRDQVDFAIDIIAPDAAETINTLLGFAETDTLCYRADPEEPLYARQHEIWEPPLASLEASAGVQFTRVSGIMHKPQPEATLAKLRARLESEGAFTLSALQAMASLSASLSIALLALTDEADHEALWDAASLEEEWQAQLWGRDYEAEERRAKRRADFLNAVAFVRLARS
jgi:chaperone required for assembly of F1-ATPase